MPESLDNPHAQSATADGDLSPRSRRRWGRIIALIVVVLVIAMLILSPWLYREWRLRDVPDVGDPFDVATFKQHAVMDSENAFTFYREAVVQFVPIETITSDLPSAAASLTGVIELGWPEATPDVVQWLDKNQSSLAKWEAGTRLPLGQDVPLTSLSVTSDLAVVDRLISFCGLGSAQAAKLQSEGRTEDAWQWHRAVLRCSRHCGMRDGLHRRILAVSFFNQSCPAVAHWASDPGVSSEQLRDALRDLEMIEAMTSPISDVLRSEYVLCMNTVDELTSELPSEFSWAPESLQPFTRQFHAEPVRAKRVTKLVFANWLTYINSPPSDQPALAGSTLQLFDASQLQSSRLTPIDIVQRCYASSPMSQEVLFGDLSLIVVAEKREQARFAGLKVLLAAQRYRRERGEFPESLDNLISADLKTSPVDPFAAAEPVRYRRDSKDSAIVWSLNDDHFDNGGEIHDASRPALNQARAPDIGFLIEFRESTPSPQR